MTGWSGYRPGDLVPFSSDAYWRLFMAENVVLWPLPVVAAVAGGMLLFRLTLQSRPVPGFPVMLLLAGVWIWVGWNFVLHRYGTLNWAGSWLVWLFLLQGALLCIHANRIDLQPAAGLRGRLGAATALFGLWGYPLLAPLNGRSLLLGEAFAIAPDPTVVTTIGVLALAGRRSLVLLVAPALWLAVSCTTLVVIGEMQGWLTAGAGVAGLTAAAWPRTPSRVTRRAPE